MPSFSLDEVEGLRARVREMLRHGEAGEKIKEVVQRAQSTEDAVAELQSGGIVEDVSERVMRDFTKFSDERTNVQELPRQAEASPSKAFLQVQVSKCSGDNDTALAGDFSIVTSWYGQRKKSSTQTSIKALKSSASFDIPPALLTHAGEIDVETLAQLPTKLGIMLLWRERRGGATHILGSTLMDWAPAIMSMSKSEKVEMELVNPQENTGVPVCTLHIYVSMVPSVKDPTKTSKAREIIRQLASTERTALEVFVDASRLFWKNYTNVRECHRSRRVCLMVRNEYGRKVPVCALLTPLNPSRSLPTARTAARYVSLLGDEAAMDLSSTRSVKNQQTISLMSDEVWGSPAAVLLCGKAGSPEERAILLCSFFLGFGLDAYVCIGKEEDGANGAMVLTKASPKKAILWDPRSGRPFGGKQAGEGAVSMSLSTLRKIHSCFNSNYVFANQQAEDGVTEVSWDFGEEAKWACLDVREFPVEHSRVAPPMFLMPPMSWSESEVIEAKLEEEMKILLERLRRRIIGDDALFSSPTVWDEGLANLLMPALEAYEQEARTGLATGNEEFQQSIKRSTPSGHTFKGSPFHATHTNAAAIVDSLAQEGPVYPMLATKADSLRYAIRCRFIPYPDGIASLWFMLGVCYRGVEG